MKIKNASDNGNVDYEILSQINSGRNWVTNNNGGGETYDNYSIGNVTNGDTLNFISHKFINSQNITRSGRNHTLNQTTNEISVNNNSDLVYNRQYRINLKNNINLVNTDNNPSVTNILEGLTESAFTPCDSFPDTGKDNVSSQGTPNNEERAFEISDTEEISENGTRQTRVPRGIVNPNYPGFQHYAHTLQDYSSTIENFYQSENEMTDDDIDLDIVDSSYEVSINQTVLDTDDLNANNNNFDDDNIIIVKDLNIIVPDRLSDKTKSHTTQDIPDLLKNVSKVHNNNDDTAFFGLTCTDSDIENNFHAKDIIGDFNKEIEDEIKQLLNYNINVQDDLEELRKDIINTFAKPIENTINNISEVVNHVIKKLVKNRCDPNSNDEHQDTETVLITETEEDSDIYKENETNSRKEMNLSRPTFLLIENNFSNKIADAILSDGKDEINLYDEYKEYDTDKISNDVENTIKQLSTELRKIIPKLDELRERDKFWSEGKPASSVTTDGNSNEIPNTSRKSKLSPTLKYGNMTCNNENPKKIAKDKEIDSFRKPKSKYKINQRAPRERRTDAMLTNVSIRNSAQNNVSVRKNESMNDYDLGSFDVYNIETALPVLDIDTIETHLKAAKEAERRKRNDREEIRRRLAMGAENDEYYSMGHTDRPGKKPSLHSRLQNGMNLQICFMNETASDNESQASDVEKNTTCNKPLVRSSIFSKSNYSLNNHPYQTRPLSVNITKHDKINSMQTGTKLRPTSLTLKTTPKSHSSHSLGQIELKESNFYALQATLQTEARMALAQAKEMARLQMERSRRSRPVSPVTEMLRRSMEKANAPLAPDRRRVSRQLLTDMNIAQLQVIVNELHSQIESLNDRLVKLLMSRDELHMGQDSMLVDIEDLTRYLGVKEQTKKTKGNTKSGVKRFTSFVHK